MFDNVSAQISASELSLWSQTAGLESQVSLTYDFVQVS